MICFMAFKQAGYQYIPNRLVVSDVVGGGIKIHMIKCTKVPQKLVLGSRK